MIKGGHRKTGSQPTIIAGNQKSSLSASNSSDRMIKGGHRKIVSQSTIIAGNQKSSLSASNSSGRWVAGFSPVLGNDCLQLVNVRPSQVGNLCFVLQEDKGWHRSHLILLCNVFALVDIDLEEDHVVHGLIHLLQVWGDHLAGSAPGCVEVDHHQLAASSLQLAGKICLVFHCMHHLQLKKLSCRSESSNKSLVVLGRSSC